MTELHIICIYFSGTMLAALIMGILSVYLDNNPFRDESFFTMIVIAWPIAIVVAAVACVVFAPYTLGKRLAERVERGRYKNGYD